LSELCSANSTDTELAARTNSNVSIGLRCNYGVDTAVTRALLDMTGRWRAV